MVLSLSDYAVVLSDFIRDNRDYYEKLCCEMLDEDEVSEIIGITAESLSGLPENEFAERCNEILIVNALCKAKKEGLTFEECYLDSFFLASIEADRILIQYRESRILYDILFDSLNV